MIKSQKGVKGMLIVVAIILLSMIVGGIFLFSRDINVIKQPVTNTQLESDSAQKEQSVANPIDASKAGSNLNYQGVVLAGNQAKLLEFNQSDYQQALQSNKLVVLYFYANWCPICRKEFPLMQDAFNELKTDQVVGFRVSFNDNETEESEKELARQFGVAYQHTKVFLKNGQRVLKSPESWEMKRYLTEIEKFL